MNNKVSASKKIRTFAIAWLSSLALFVISLIVNLDIQSITYYMLALLIIFIAVAFAKGGFYYIETESNKESFKIKHFNLFPLTRQYSAIEIRWSRFYNYEVVTKYRGKAHFLILYEQTGRGLAKYPAIGLTALNKSELMSLTEMLEKRTKSKQHKK
ncbi:hypothetical protein QA597_02435 [Marinilabiliaceae bacterium ANBcel2]|nr:hypothetical protein [Marinilabiliaceae bacterium ANBcel2]